MSDSGWVKLHRKMLEWEWADEPNVMHLFIHLLLNANHKDKKWHGMTIKRGQFVTGLGKLSEQTGLSVQTIRTCIKRLKSTGEVTDLADNRGRIITICKWDDYQLIYSDRPTEHLTINQQATNKQLTTTKNDKNENNDNNNTIVVDQKLNDEVKQVFEKADGKLNKSNSPYKRTQLRKQKIRLRLRTFGIKEVLRAFDNTARSPHHAGDNDRGWRANIDFVIRSDEQMERLLDLYPPLTEAQEKKKEKVRKILKGGVSSG